MSVVKAKSMATTEKIWNLSYKKSHQNSYSAGKKYDQKVIKDMSKIYSRLIIPSGFPWSWGRKSQGLLLKKQENNCESQ